MSLHDGARCGCWLLLLFLCYRAPLLPSPAIEVLVQHCWDWRSHFPLTSLQRSFADALHCASNPAIFHWLHPPLSILTSTRQLCRQMISQQGGPHRAKQQAVGLKVGVCEVFRLKWLRNCGRYSAFRCLMLWGLSWVIKTCITLKRHLEIYFFKSSALIGQKIN